MEVPFQARGGGEQEKEILYYDLFPSSLKTFSYSHANISSFSAATRSQRRLHSLGGEVPGFPSRTLPSAQPLPKLVSVAGPINLKKDQDPAAPRRAREVNAALREPPRAGTQPAHWWNPPSSWPMGGGCEKFAAAAAGAGGCGGGTACAEEGPGPRRPRVYAKGRVCWVGPGVPFCAWGRGRNDRLELPGGPGGRTVS